MIFDANEMRENASAFLGPLLRKCVSTVRAIAVNQNEYITIARKEVLFEFPVEFFEDECLVGPQLTARNENAVVFYDLSSP